MANKNEGNEMSKLQCMGVCTKRASKTQIEKCNKCTMLPKTVDDENLPTAWLVPTDKKCEYFKTE